ncbi:hypothetical protein TEA_009809 [Camellia sinensis var. sinensis]|uniref:Uncharacterized protein n=1 Tax=Camellia sinensis var. sinensis TaxID=542762 RepID=A0A4S4EIE4_CAMSN|nr:hypothetical protein TEA_009809 [Camellia sinensis var. sinensis]
MLQDMWNAPPGFRSKKSAPSSPGKPLAVSRTRSGSLHITHKVPVGDTPYARAKNVQLVDKDPEKAIPRFWAATNAGDRVDSALKDMAITRFAILHQSPSFQAIAIRHKNFNLLQLKWALALTTAIMALASTLAPASDLNPLQDFCVAVNDSKTAAPLRRSRAEQAKRANRSGEARRRRQRGEERGRETKTERLGTNTDLV